MKEMDEKAYIFGAIFALSNRLQNLGDKLDDTITVKQWLLIAMISKSDHSEPTISEVAQMIGSTRQNVKKMALILEKQGFIKLRKDDNDARIVRLSLTEKCEVYFQGRIEKEGQFTKQLFHDFGDQLLNGLYNGLNKLAENIIAMEDVYKNEEKE